MTLFRAGDFTIEMSHFVIVDILRNPTSKEGIFLWKTSHLPISGRIFHQNLNHYQNPINKRSDIKMSKITRFRRILFPITSLLYSSLSFNAFVICRSDELQLALQQRHKKEFW